MKKRGVMFKAILGVMMLAILTACAGGPRGVGNAAGTDVVVYGATPGGIAAAIAAAKHGRQVVLIEPTSRIGGLSTNGLTHTDFRTLESLNGSFLEFCQRIEKHYAAQGERQVKESLHGTQFEPELALRVFNEMLAEHPAITVKTSELLSGVAVSGRRIESIRVRDERGRERTYRAAIFIDGSYEGDLMAKAGVKWTVGREGRDAYGESLAPEKADGQLQGYNFRLTMTKREDIRVPAPLVPGYNRADYLPLLEMMRKGELKGVFGTTRGYIYKAQVPPQPNGKYDINDISNGNVRLSLPGDQLAWPDGDEATRKKIFEEHLRHNVGMFYFLHNDAEVPAKFRDEANQWGFCRDEYPETNHLPVQLYVREARRMIGVHVFTERDTDCADGDVRAVLRTDAIAMGDYGPNCHGTFHEGPRFGGKHTGEFYKRVPPYQVAYGTLLPREIDNLLVPVAASSSHVGFCALRLEPIWMSLGEAAGHAAHLALAANQPVQQVDVAKLQRELHAEKSATIYVSDVPPSSRYFAAVQWWATQGALHGMTARQGDCGERGANLIGQYYHAFPGHALGVNEPIDEATARRWSELASRSGVKFPPQITPGMTRGQYLTALFKAMPK